MFKKNTKINYKLEMTNVHKSFGPKSILQGVDLKIKKGESLVIIGGSGTGKSVMIKCIQGLLVPEYGSIKVDGQEIVGMNEKNLISLNDKMGMLFQNAALFDSLKVWENVAFKFIQKGVKTEKAREIAKENLAEVGMDENVMDLSPAELSGGMRKRVGLARAIATKPEFIFFDEPTTGLDPIMSDVINNLIVKCVKKLGATALTITHDMASAMKIADNIAMLYQGKIIWCDKVAKVKNSGNEYVEQFIKGSSVGPIQMEVLAK